MKNVEKYTKQYFNPPVCEMKWAKKTSIDKAPVWCSVDLRDGNQSLMVPMNLEEKLEFLDAEIPLPSVKVNVSPALTHDRGKYICRLLIEYSEFP